MPSSIPDSQPTYPHFAAHVEPHAQWTEKAVKNYSSPLGTLFDPAVTFPDMKRGNTILGEVKGKQTVPKKKEKKKN